VSPSEIRFNRAAVEIQREKLFAGENKKNTLIQKDQVEGMLSILSPSLNPSHQGREAKCRYWSFVDNQEK